MTMVYCSGCGKEMHARATTCPHCGLTNPNVRQAKNKVIAGLLALSVGGSGIHRFYLGQWRGVLYIIFIWTFIPSLIAFIEGIVFLVSSDEKWERKYGVQVTRD